MGQRNGRQEDGDVDEEKVAGEDKAETRGEESEESEGAEGDQQVGGAEVVLMRPVHAALSGRRCDVRALQHCFARELPDGRGAERIPVWGGGH